MYSTIVPSVGKVGTLILHQASQSANHGVADQEQLPTKHEAVDE